MSLADHQARVARVCLEPTPDPARLAALGDPGRWGIYRSMVRARLHRVCERALERTRQALGEAPFAALVDRWLAEAPPATRFFRELPSEMVAWALRAEGAALDSPTHARDLMRYELAVWEIKAADDSSAPPVVDFDFQGVPSFSPASQLVEVSHGVDRRADDGSVEPLDGALLVYRTTDFRAKCLRLNPMASSLVRELRSAEGAGRSVTEAVQRAAAQRGVAIDQKLIEGLSGLLEKLLTRGALRGCLKTLPGESP